jgi:hypothetical protein
MAYSASQLEQLWTQAGGDPKQAPLMAAIALAESSGNPSAHNPSGASGLWQILGNPVPGNAFDPLTNARMAVAKYKSQGLGAWTTYTSGAYKPFLPSTSSGGGGIAGSLTNVGIPVGAIGSVASGIGSAVSGVGSAVSSAASVGQSVGQIASLVTSTDFWLRIGEFILGILALYLGLHALTGQSSTPGQQVKHVTRIVPLPV